MNVWLLQTGEPIPLVPGIRKLRTALMADQLVARGHDVVWWSSTFDHESKRSAFDQGDTTLDAGYMLRFLRGTPYRRNVSLSRYVGTIMLARRFRAAAARERPPDLIVASMPDYFLAAEAVRYAHSHNVPIVIDVRDRWPDVLAEVVPGWLRPVANGFLTWDRAKLRYLIRNADAVTSMMDSMLEWALAKADRLRGPWDRVFYLGADASLEGDPVVASTPVRACVDAVGGRFVVTFAGTFGHFNDPAVILDAALLLNSTPTTRDRVTFVMAGSGPQFEEIVRRSGGAPNIHFPGWVGEEDIRALLATTSVAVIASPPGYAAFPNKAFTYLASGVPFLSSVEGELRTLQIERGFGRSFEARQPASLATEIRRLLDSPSDVETMKRAAGDFFREEGQASVIYARFVSHLETMVASRNPACGLGALDEHI